MRYFIFLFAFGVALFILTGSPPVRYDPGDIHYNSRPWPDPSEAEVRSDQASGFRYDPDIGRDTGFPGEHEIRSIDQDISFR